MGVSPVLVAFAGLPGTGKSTIAKLVARELRAAYLRVDTVEQALRESGELNELVVAGYSVLFGLAADNLALGVSVVADSVNPVAFSRTAWIEVAQKAGVRLVGVELICSDTSEHRRRIETRTSEIAGLDLPDWQAVIDRDYEDWADADLVIDTATHDAHAAAAKISSFAGDAA